MSFEKLPMVLDPPSMESDGRDILDIALETVRQHLGMEVAYLSEFVGDLSIFRAVSAPGLEEMAFPGKELEKSAVYCQHILDGRLPRLIPDTSAFSIAREMPITHAVPIGSHVSVPVHREDGSVYGMFCCLSPTPNPSLNERDLRVMETFAAIAAGQLNKTLIKRAEQAEAALRIDGLLQGGEGLQIVLQPIVELATGELTGFEALSRFSGTPYRTPDVWFSEANALGRQIELEALAVSKALALMPQLPPGASLSINASPETVTSGILATLAEASEPHRLVVELTEHAIIENYERVSEEIERLRALGVRIAADDVGAGHSGLTQILRLKPEVMKLDLGLVRDIDTDSAKRSLVRGMVYFADEIGTRIVAEGIETEAELVTLRRLGVHKGQGYHIGRPVDLAGTQAWLAARALPQAV
ncbi:sensor domain-containing phosphodiesterase [Pseudoroseicyclus tamaricis]|nr:EAL domain-containing protein [Pseudoroseicyclus tamaricis]